jgi:hypothetical protein
MKFDLYKDLLNIAFSVAYIGKGSEITLFYKRTGEYMVSSDEGNYYPMDQGEIYSFDYKSTIQIPQDAEGDFSKKAAIKLIDEIYIEFQRDEQQEDIQIH